MKFSDIETFLSIVETGSLTKAAEKLYMSQSSVSHQLRNLEEELGLTLINRQKGQRDISMTSEGMKFIPLAQRWMALWQDMISLHEAESVSSVSIGCPRNLLLYVLPSLIDELQGVSNLNLKVCTMRSSEVYTQVENRSINIGLAFEQPQRQSAVISEPLFSEQMCLIRIKKTNITFFQANPHDLDPRNEIYFPWFQEYVTWHNACWDSTSGHAIEINSSALIPFVLNEPNRWMITPLSVAVNFKKTLPIEILELTSPPPNRTCYRLTHKNPKICDAPALEKINSFIDEFCMNLPWDNYVF